MTGEIIFTGYLPEQELVDFYNAAQVFVYPSMYEGFGFPPLEAMVLRHTGNCLKYFIHSRSGW